MSTHQQLLYHVIFSVKERRTLLKDDEFRLGVWAYMAGICSNLKGFAIAIGGYYDHAHMLVRIPGKLAVADFVGRVKANTSKHINEMKHLDTEFHWQDGYGAFTLSPSQIPSVVDYIENQIEHHKKLTFQEKYLNFLARHEIEYDPKYLWE